MNEINDQMDVADVPSELLQLDAEGNPVPVTVQTVEDTGAEDQPLN